MCQEFPKEKWIDAQKENVLDAPYYHVVFTVPEELNPIIYSNQKLLYDALYHTASSTLNELAKDSKYLGADIGYICILHTWGSAMIVIGNPLKLSPDFPPLHTVHATFTAHGVPSNSVVQGFQHTLHTSN